MACPPLTRRTVTEAPAPPSPPSPTIPPGAQLPARDGHRVWWCEGGDPAGRPVLIVHGGPGGSTRAEPAGWFTGLPVRWLAIDQRGCGRSEPAGETRCNRLPDLIDDMERLRQSLGLERWALVGGSWGARVALSYALRHPSRVEGLFLRSPFLATVDETRRYITPWRDWLGEEGRASLGESLVSAVHTLYHDGTESFTPETVSAIDAAVLSDAVTRAWAAFDEAQSAAGGLVAKSARWRETGLSEASPALKAAWAVHAHHALRGWGALDGLPTGVLLPRLAAGAPVQLVWGEDDATCDPAGARPLCEALTAAGLAVRADAVPGAGHRMGDSRLAAALRAAAPDWIGRLAQRDPGPAAVSA